MKKGNSRRKSDRKSNLRKNSNTTVNRQYKNTIFQMIFHQKKELLSLYNALNDTDYVNEEELNIVTLENAVYMSMKNDLAFILDMRLHMYEHQSTHNPNIPLRDLFYVSQEYQMLVDKKSLYGSKVVKIPAPRFVVFYNGLAKQPERQWMKLSDMYELYEEEPMLELKVLVLNINQGSNEGIKEKCRTLQEYMLYIERIRLYTEEKGMVLQEAVETAVDECIKEGILEEFLRKNKAEAIAVSIFEYDEEKELRLLREAEREYGIEIGEARGEARGKSCGLLVLVRSLKRFLTDFDALYVEVTSNDEYKDVTEEEVRKLFEQIK